jgi:hypothetical protein
LARTPEAVAVIRFKIGIFDFEIAKAKENPNIKAKKADAKDNRLLRTKPSRYIPEVIVEKLPKVNSSSLLRKENLTTAVRGHPKNTAIKMSRGSRPINLLPLPIFLPLIEKNRNQILQQKIPC